MKSIEAVKTKRDELKAELERFREANENRKHNGMPKSDMSDLEKAEYMYIVRSMHELRCQINCLNFVLNEDFELSDATKPIPSQELLGVKKENVITKYTESGDVNNEF